MLAVPTGRYFGLAEVVLIGCFSEVSRYRLILNTCLLQLQFILGQLDHTIQISH